MAMFSFIIKSFLLGVGLAMDAFSVSLANGLNNPKMNKSKMLMVAGTFAVFQGLMPMIGWFCVHNLVNYFKTFEKFIPWIALGLLVFIGGNMLLEGIKGEEDDDNSKDLTLKALMVQGVATSIDALSVGFTIAEYGFSMALISVLIIAVVTFIICFVGIIIGKKVGMKFAGKASIMGGIILILIGAEIFFTGVF